MNTAIEPNLSVTAWKDSLERLIDKSAIAKNLFSSPILLQQDCEQEWLLRFMVFGEGRRAHDTVLALVAGVGLDDVQSSLFTLNFVHYLSDQANSAFPDILAYPKLSVHESSPDRMLTDVDWLNSGNYRLATLSQEFRESGVTGYILAQSKADISQPIIQVSADWLGVLSVFDQDAYFIWQEEGVSKAPQGSEYSAKHALELHILLPTVWSSEEQEPLTMKALYRILERFAAYLVQGQNI